MEMASLHPASEPWRTTLVSPDLRHITIMEWGSYYALFGPSQSSHLHLYDMLTRQCLASIESRSYPYPWFTLDGREVWSVKSGCHNQGWKIIEDGESNITRLEPLSHNQQPSGLTWKSSCDYKVTDDGWVLSPSKKRLLLLPPSWRSGEENMMWGGQFLALLGGGLPEPVILELEE
ncbi:hypothetical protein BDM02DRAFT_3264468 [Thelephora ganbajun]|uniref:Uncharacterized protein n=1 Tax=Thelephora ganbajun TaxID=370292 RepID=A0ACB6YYI6_THEGA|nr:hypothetical protein BDM02DRAFT_3264468 [Thelephora ganbajun]